MKYLEVPKDVERIIVSDSSSETAVFAAQELGKYLKKVTGAKFPVVKNGKAADKSFFLSFGTEKDDDSFNISVNATSKRISIKGSNPRSLLFGVYDFLKGNCGILWPAPGTRNEILPECDSFRIKEEHRREKALMKLRGFYIDSSQESVNEKNVADVVDWVAKNSGNFLLVSLVFYGSIKKQLAPALKKRGLILEVGHHGFRNYVDPADHFKKHPEWFSMIDGKRTPGVFAANMIHNSQLCVSNKEVIDVYTDAFIKYGDENPEIEIQGIMPNDGFGWCQCPDCMKIEGKEQASPLRYDGFVDTRVKLGSRRYHHFLNEVSKRLEKLRPGRRISLAAYAGVIMPSPLVKSLPENTVFTIALYERWYNYLLNDRRGRAVKGNPNPKLVDILMQWRELFPGIINIYEYYAKYAWQSAPKWLPDTIRQDVNFLSAKKIEGLISMVEVQNFSVYELNHMAQLAMSWSKAWTSDKLLKDYTEKRFGPMAKKVLTPVEKVIKTMEPYAKLGPAFPEKLVPAAQKSFEKLSADFKTLSEKAKADGAVSPGTSKLLKTWSVSSNMAWNGLEMTRQYWRLNAAVEKEDYEKALEILQDFKKAKKNYFETYKRGIKAGAALENRLWFVSAHKKFFENEDNLEKLIKKRNKSEEDITKIKSNAGRALKYTTY